MKLPTLVFLFWLFANCSFAITANTHSDNEWVQEVFKKITAAKGDYSRNLPQIVITEKKASVAKYDTSTRTIYLEQTVLDICKTFAAKKDDALAFILGHELTHFYQKHDWEQAGFATSFITSQELFQKYYHQEEEADLYAAFLAYLAGYDPVAVIPNLLEAIYHKDNYDLKGKKLIAAPLAIRKAVATRICKKIQQLTQIFETGNYLLAIGQYEGALNCFDYILKFVECREIYNNIGVAAFYTAMSNAPHLFPFRYPMLLDVSFSVRAPSNLTTQELLQKANKYFRKAIFNDPTYLNGFINLICVNEATKNYAEVATYTQQLEKLPLTKEELVRLSILKGIVAGNQKNRLMAEEYFAVATESSQTDALDSIIAYNKKVLSGEKTRRTRRLVSIENQIGGYSIFDYAFQYPDTLLFQPKMERPILLQREKREGIIYLEFRQSSLASKLLLTKSKAHKTSMNIQCGQSIKQVNEKMEGNKVLEIPHNFGFFQIYPLKGLLFNFSRTGQLKEWGVFTK